MKSYIILILLFVSLNAYSQQKSKHYKELAKFLPEAVAGFHANADVVGNMFQMNGMSYSTVVRDYHKDDTELTVTIMDYQGAKAMYDASTAAWDQEMSYEDDEQVAHSITIDGLKGWFSHNKVDQESSVLLGLDSRYLINIQLSNNKEMELAKQVARALEFDKLNEE